MGRGCRAHFPFPPVGTALVETGGRIWRLWCVRYCPQSFFCLPGRLLHKLGNLLSLDLKLSTGINITGCFLHSCCLKEKCSLHLRCHGLRGVHTFNTQAGKWVGPVAKAKQTSCIPQLWYLKGALSTCNLRNDSSLWWNYNYLQPAT